MIGQCRLFHYWGSEPGGVQGLFAVQPDHVAHLGLECLNFHLYIWDSCKGELRQGRMFRAIIVVFGRNKVRKGHSKGKYVGKDVSAGHSWVGRAGGRPLCVLVEKPKHCPIYCMLPGTAQAKKKV